MLDINKMRETTFSGFILLDYIIMILSTELIVEYFNVHKFLAYVIFYLILYIIYLIDFGKFTPLYI